MSSVKSSLIAMLLMPVAANLVFTATTFAGQGAQRMLYTVPNNEFIEDPSGDNVVAINDTSGSIATLQTLINSARGANPNSIIVIHLLSGATYWVDNNVGGIVLGSQECLVGSGALIEATNAAVTNALIQISPGATNVSVAGGTLNGNGANIYGIYAPSSSARVNIDKETVRNCGQDCIQLNGNGGGTFDNEMTVARCDVSGSPGHAGISIWNATQTICVDNNCHNNSVGIWIGNGGYRNIANNTCESNSVGIDDNGGNDDYIANDTCNNNDTGILAAGSGGMIVSDSLAGNSVAGINSSGSGNIYADNLFAGGNAVNFVNDGSGDDVVAYQAPISAAGQNYFYPPLINNQHTDTIINGVGRYDITNDVATTIDAVQSQYNAAVNAHPGDVIVLHLNGNYTVGANPLALGSDTCILLGGTIQINSATAASCAITATNASYLSISGGTIDDGTTTSSGAGHNGIYFTGVSIFQIDAVTLQNFGTSSTRVGGSDVIRIDHGGTPRIVTRCTITNGSARGIWLATSGPRDIVSDNTVSGVQMDGVDCDESTSASLVKFNYLHNNTRYGVFVEQSAFYNLLLGNIWNDNSSYDIGCYNNSSTPRGSTEYNSIVCNSLMGGNGLRNGSTGTNVVTTSHNFYFDNTVMNANIHSQLYGTQNYYSQNYMGNSSLSTSGAEVFFNSPDVSGNLYVQDSRSGLDAVVTNASTTDGAAVIPGRTSLLGSDQWSLIPTDSGYYRLMNQNSGLAMVVLSASTNAGAPIIQWTYNTGGNDEWMPVSAGNGLYYFVNRQSGLYLDVPGAGTTPGTQLDQQPFTGGANQQFNLIDSVVPASNQIPPNSVTWTGGSLSSGNWSDAANWGGIALTPEDSLTFTGTTRLFNFNDTAANTGYSNIVFNPGAGAFLLTGNPITLTGTSIVNDSLNAQTIYLGLNFDSDQTFDGADGPLIIAGGLTNIVSGPAITTLTLAGGGQLSDAWNNTSNPGGTNEIVLNDASSDWTVVHGAVSTETPVSWVFEVNEGTLNFGTTSSAPTVTLTTPDNSPSDNQVGNVSGAIGTFNLVNGTLTSASRFDTGTAADATGIVNQLGGTFNIGVQFQGANAVHVSTGVSIVNLSGGVMNINPSGGTNGTFYVASRGMGTLNLSDNARLNCGTLDVSRGVGSEPSQGIVNLNGGTIGVANVTDSSTMTGSTAIFNFNGGTLRAQANSTTFFTQSATIPLTANVQSGGAVFDTAGFDDYILPSLLTIEAKTL